ncbi:MAG: hypothetical protein ACYC1C_14100 [Chloroflexota bacterium]
MSETRNWSQTDIWQSEPIEKVREGMNVVDATGVDLGAVDMIHFGDPEAVTTKGEEPEAAHGLLADLARALAFRRPEPDVPDPEHSRLVRIGFFRVKREGFAGEYYVAADQVDKIDVDTVTLKAKKSELIAK